MNVNNIKRRTPKQLPVIRDKVSLQLEVICKVFDGIRINEWMENAAVAKILLGPQEQCSTRGQRKLTTNDSNSFLGQRFHRSSGFLYLCSLQ